MFRISMFSRANLLARTAPGIAIGAAALALGVVTGGAVLSTPAMAAKTPKPPKLALSKPFQTVAAPLSTAIDGAKARPDVVAATNNVKTAEAAYQQSKGAARTQAKASYDAAVAALGNTLAAEKSQLDTAFAAISTPDDKFTFGQLAISLGGTAMDKQMQRRGLSAMIDSGKSNPADVPRLQYFLGSTAYDMKDYPAARTALQAAVSAGYHDNDADALLAEAYISDNQAAQGLTMLQQAIDYRNGTASKAPAGWYRRGLGAAYKAKLSDQAAKFSLGLVKAYPNAENWAGAITVLREVGGYQGQEVLDLMRLMGRTNSYAEGRDYLEYLQVADPRRLPGEAIKVIDAGRASGKIKADDLYVSDSRKIASDRMAADRASLPATERAARAGASATNLMGVADAYLSYGDSAKAEELFTLALTKQGVDAPRALTRIGIAQFDQGKYAEAQVTFAKVTGSRKSIADLWALYAAQKAAPAA